MANLDKIVAAGVESFDDIKDDCFRDLMKAAAFSILHELRDNFIKHDCTACGGNWTYPQGGHSDSEGHSTECIQSV